MAEASDDQKFIWEMYNCANTKQQYRIVELAQKGLDARAESDSLARANYDYCTENASLKSERDEMRKALEPFQKAWAEVLRLVAVVSNPAPPDYYKAFVSTTDAPNAPSYPLFEFGDLRRASQTLQKTEA